MNIFILNNIKMNKYIQLLTDALYMGILLSIIGIIIIFIFNKIFKSINYYSYIIIFLLCGILFHLICVFTGINKLYCKNELNLDNNKENLDNITLKDFNPEIINPAFIRVKK